MNRQLVAGITAVVLLTLAVVAGAVMLLRDVNTSDTAEGADPAAETGVEKQAEESTVPVRPDCPAAGVGGIGLDCLGGDTGEADADAGTVVANVWAWWCGPCREELPVFEDFATQHPEYTVVGVHADANPTNGAAFLNELDLSLASYQDDDNRFAGTLGLPNVVPITVVFHDGEQIGMFPTPFDSVGQLEEAVDGALEEAAA